MICLFLISSPWWRYCWIFNPQTDNLTKRKISYSFIAWFIREDCNRNSQFLSEGRSREKEQEKQEEEEKSEETKKRKRKRWRDKILTGIVSWQWYLENVYVYWAWWTLWKYVIGTLDKVIIGYDKRHEIG